MELAFWIAQFILCTIFVSVGYMKIFAYKKAKAESMWIKDLSRELVGGIGLAEILGGIGILLPYATGFKPILTPIAALGLAVILILAAEFHRKRKEYTCIPVNILLLLLTLFVAIVRL